MKILLSLILSTVILSSGISAYAQNDQIPEWVKGIAEFWAEDKITDEEYINAMKFLIENDIIKISDPEVAELKNEIIELNQKIELLESWDKGTTAIELVEMESTSDPKLIQEYYESGQLEREEQLDKNGDTEWVKKYYETGELELQEQYDDGDRKWRSVYYKSGQLDQRIKISDNNKFESARIYYETGEFEAKVNYNDEGIAKYSEWYFKGKLDTEYIHNKEGGHKFSKDYYETGELKFESEYTKDGKGIENIKSYDKNGQLRQEFYYDGDGNLIDEDNYDENGIETK